MDNKYKLIVDYFGKERFKFEEPLKDYTALGVGGPAKLFFIAFTQAELIKIIKLCRQLKLRFFIFGTGSKIMFSDNGFDGLVIKNRTKNIHVVSVKGIVSKIGIGVEEALIEVESGVSLNKLVEFLDNNSFSAMEFKNITGTVGGNLFVNGFLQTRTKSIKVLDSDSEKEEISYLELSLKKHIILSAVFSAKSKY
ncbi:FAD-binding protein [Candidatus Daviesbacteria bacterium]|nr:FAD-binding protein [Candidatus Daviesbacteria bacterium]